MELPMELIRKEKKPVVTEKCEIEFRLDVWTFEILIHRSKGTDLL